jgi:phage terminase large subunit GpA-like protein
MDAIADDTVREIWVQKSSQIGWTEILGNVIGYHIDQDPAPILLVQPTLEMAEAWSKDRLAPMLRDTPCLHGKVADARARDSGNTLLHKQFPGGHVTMAGANSPAGLASRPIRILLFDEVDRFPASAGTEGDPISIGRKRAATFWNRKLLAGSTPTVKGSSRIETGFEGSDQRFFYVPCLHCGEFQRLVWANVRWEEGRPDTAAYCCQACGALIGDCDKLAMLRRGEWRATKPSTGIAGFHVSELYSPWVTWAEMARAFLEAKKLPETLQTFINTALGETWEDGGETLDAGTLEKRKESYTAASLPSGVLLLTRGTDVQDDRLESTLWGWGADGEKWRVEHDVLRGDPGSLGSGSVWTDHDQLLERRYTTDDGRTLVCEAAAVDSGGHFTEQVYEYCARRKRRRVWAIKGVGGPGRLAWAKKASRGGKHRRDVWPVGVDTIKDVLYGHLRNVKEPGPGFTHFDATTDQDYLDQLTSETLVYRMVMGRKVKAWRPRQTGIRQEALDCAVYAYAAMVGRGGYKLIGMRLTAQPAPSGDAQPGAPAKPTNENTDVMDLTGGEEPERRGRGPRPRRGGWMNWRR